MFDFGLTPAIQSVVGVISLFFVYHTCCENLHQIKPRGTHGKNSVHWVEKKKKDKAH